VKTMNYSESRARYAETLDSVVNDREEVVITRAGHEPVVIVSLDDYQSLKEMAHLGTSRPSNIRSPGPLRPTVDVFPVLLGGALLPRLLRGLCHHKAPGWYPLGDPTFVLAIRHRAT
jgi:antitoxin YefM